MLIKAKEMNSYEESYENVSKETGVLISEKNSINRVLKLT